MSTAWPSALMEARALSASGDYTLKLWDLTTTPATCIQTLNGHTHVVTSVAISPDGKKALSASYDRTLKLWDLYPSPEKRISALAARCLPTDSSSFKQEFQQLPLFAQNGVYGMMYRILSVEGALPSTTPRNYGQLAFHGKTTPPISTRQKARALHLYNAVRVALPSIQECFDTAAYFRTLEGSGEEGPLLSSSTIQRLLELSPEIRNLIYGALYEVQSEAKTLPKTTPRNYGELAFANRDTFTATDEERSKAIHYVIEKLKTEYGLKK